MVNVNNNPNTILIIGNGFDLDLGLNTSYKSFIDTMYECEQHPESKNILIDDMIKKYRKCANWIDIELFLRDYAISYSNKDIEKNRNIELEYRKLCNDLNTFMVQYKYLDDKKNYLGEYVYNIGTISSKLLEWISNQPNSRVYSFNYTNMNDVARSLNKQQNLNIKDFDIRYIHGETCSSYNGRIAPIILGIDDVKVKDEFKCMIKSTHSSYNSGIMSDLPKATHVVFFGFGMGQTDHPYFKDFFKMIENGKLNTRISVFNISNSSAFYGQLVNMKIDVAKIRECSNIHFYCVNDNGLNDFYNETSRMQ